MSTGSDISGPGYSERLRGVVTELERLFAHRHETQTTVDERHAATVEAADRELAETLETATAQLEDARRAADARIEKARQQIQKLHDADVAVTRQEAESLAEKIRAKAELNEQTASKRLQDAIWVAESVFEAYESQPRDAYERARKTLDEQMSEVESIAEEAATFLRKCRQRAPAPQPADHVVEDPAITTGAKGEPADDGELLAEARRELRRLARLTVPRLFRGAIPFILAILTVSLAATVTAWANQWHLAAPVFLGAGGGLLVALVAGTGLYLLARSQVRSVMARLDRVLATIRAGHSRRLADAAAARSAREAELIETRDSEIRTANEKYEPILAEIRSRRDSFLERITEKCQRQLEKIRARRDTDLGRHEAEYEQAVRDAQEVFDATTTDARQRHALIHEESRALYDHAWAELKQVWSEGLARVHEAITQIMDEDRRLFPDWTDPAWEEWTPPFTFAPIVRFGALHVDLETFPGGVPDDERLPLPGPAQFDLPAILEFPDRCSLLVQSGDQGRDEAVRTLQSVMMRLLTTLPPGKVRFTIIDPVGLGQNFAGFMHLADHDGALVGDKIWTEIRHIEQRLTDLTEHMEHVIQKYLRNEFETIDDYNTSAGEIAEPYRFLVVCDFPVNFSETAAKRLASIINSGSRCGVFTLINVDRRQPLPQGIQKTDLEASGVHLLREKERFHWEDPLLKRLPLTLDAPPAEAFMTRTLNLIGAAAKDSSRVEVPFSAVTPAANALWKRSSGRELRVPLGRAGATKLQDLALGHGTAQHVLIAGKTGSGKSTLLHVLITNLALWYSPDQVEFYLVDFKKGVEFKTYATNRLPHARVVAIETDREFGLSVLQRVDAELKRRGNRFREVGVQDLPGFRHAAPDEPMPRTLLIIDEFQELFVEDDKLAQDGALLMDRLVRQGRAFGIHVILGSQTLGGAYTLARSTIGQMAVRIALQCNESDSYLILSDDNAAARLLSRPGEALYNDSSGAVEGNSPFQVVWLPDDHRELCLKRIETLADERLGDGQRRGQIVFEGNVPADLERNGLLEAQLAAAPARGPATGPSAAAAWLGEAIAIKDPTAAVFHRRSGSNLLIVGQRDETSLAMMTAALVSLAAQAPPEDAEFVLLDGTPADAELSGYLARAAHHLPQKTHVVAWQEVAAAINGVAEELDRRQRANETGAQPIYLMIHGLQRFRMLRQEEEFTFSISEPDQPPSPESQFARILSDGPVFGIHTLTWCDTLNNVNRTVGRQGLREFEMRVLFQMSATDSTNLIDSPAAAKLGLHRAIFTSEEEGHQEKFRPYALPEPQWLEEAGARLASGARGSGGRRKRSPVPPDASEQLGTASKPD